MLKPPRRARQLALDLPPREAFGREDFLVSPSNRDAMAFVDAWPHWPDGRALLVGPPGSGKSHLAAIWAETAGARRVAAASLVTADIAELAMPGALVIEDADAPGRDDVALFHLLNQARETGAALLITARDQPAHWGVGLADLASRLRALPAVAIDTPDDQLVKSVLVKLFDDRQLLVDAALIEFLTRRIDRSLDAARAVVARLDAEALSLGRRITRTMAAAVINDIEQPTGEI